jgi:hypothetical protein
MFTNAEGVETAFDRVSIFSVYGEICVCWKGGGDWCMVYSTWVGRWGTYRGRNGVLFLLLRLRGFGVGWGRGAGVVWCGGVGSLVWHCVGWWVGGV